METTTTTGAINALTYQMLTDEKHNTVATKQLKTAALQLSLIQKIQQEHEQIQVTHRCGEGASKNGFCVVSADQDGVQLKVQDTQSAKQTQT